MTPVKIKNFSFGIFLLLFCFYWAGAANASIMGIAVNDPNIDGTTQVGSLGGPSPDGQIAGEYGLVNAIEYYIPLNDSNYGGTYGVTPTFNCAGGGTAAAGTCRDYGNGNYGVYNTATGLYMNIFFNTGFVEAASVILALDFDDLDLVPDNDPDGFKESVSLSFWDWDGTDFVLNPLDSDPVANAIKETSVAPNPVNTSPNQVTWELSLASLDAFNTSSVEKGGFWIQLGFGAKSSFYGKNTPEYLTAALQVSPVPLPTAFWLFGTALLGFIGISRRTTV